MNKEAIKRGLFIFLTFTVFSIGIAVLYENLLEWKGKSYLNVSLPAMLLTLMYYALNRKK